MKNTAYSGYCGPRMSPSVQSARVHHVIEHELTAAQRHVIEQYYLHGKTIIQIADERGVNKSTVCRTLQRAEKRIRQILRY